MSSETTSTPVPVGKLLKADSIASIYRADIEASIKAFASSPSHSRKPKLVGILATDSKPSEMYAEFTRKTCEDIGVEFVLKRVGAAVKKEEGDAGSVGSNGEGVELAIIEANEDVGVDGMMVRDILLIIRFIKPQSLASATSSALTGASPTAPTNSDIPPEGTIKSILPCTPLAIVKCLEFMGVYNILLPYGDRAYGRTVTVINRSEVVGRPLAALLSNDGARVFSVDIDSVQEYNKRPASSTPTGPSRLYYPRHVVNSSSNTLEQCLALSDVVISAVPSASYKVDTGALKDGCICVNVSSEKNFEKDVREKASLYLPSVGKVTIMMLLRNLMRLTNYQDILKQETSKSNEQQ
ncbi:hypothetical protein FRC05_010440 [Tulasnella sp. 425]|nr:hypothetical protein FRC05_010440 [Tulasnella sp. 425]